MTDETLQIGSFLIIITGEYSDVQSQHPVRLLKPIVKSEVAHLYRDTFKPDDDGYIDQDPSGFLSWLVRERYVEAVDNVNEWHVGSYGEFEP